MSQKIVKPVMFTNADDVTAKSAKNPRVALKSNVVSYHYVNAAKTEYEIRLDGEIKLATGAIMDTDKRRGFSLSDGKITVYFRTMAEVREYVRQNMVVKENGATFHIKVAK